MHHLLDCSNTTYYKKPHKVLKSSGYELHYNDTHHFPKGCSRSELFCAES